MTHYLLTCGRTVTEKGGVRVGPCGDEATSWYVRRDGSGRATGAVARCAGHAWKDFKRSPPISLAEAAVLEVMSP